MKRRPQLTLRGRASTKIRKLLCPELVEILVDLNNRVGMLEEKARQWRKR